MLVHQRVDAIRLHMHSAQRAVRSGHQSGLQLFQETSKQRIDLLEVKKEATQQVEYQPLSIYSYCIYIYIIYI